MNETASKPVLYLILCAAPPAQHMHTFLPALQMAGWDVCVIATPQATRWIQIPDLEAITGHMVRTDYKLPGEADPLPKAAAILVMPATFNTINEAGPRADTLAEASTNPRCESSQRYRTRRRDDAFFWSEKANPCRIHAFSSTLEAGYFQNGALRVASHSIPQDLKHEHPLINSPSERV